MVSVDQFGIEIWQNYCHCKIIFWQRWFLFFYTIDPNQQYSHPHHLLSSAIDTLLLSFLFQAYFCWFCFHIQYASLVGSFDFVHRVCVRVVCCLFVCFPFQFLYGWCLCTSVLRVCTVYRCLSGTNSENFVSCLVQMPIAEFYAELPSFMPSCRVLCRVKIRARKIMGHSASSCHMSQKNLWHHFDSLRVCWLFYATNEETLFYISFKVISV